LRRLENQGLFKAYNTTYNSRIRKYYQVTKTERNKINESLIDFKEIKSLNEFILR
jgi:DNA-binding PadR family transcriptional regulator